MVMLADHYDYVIGGDPDRDTIDLAVVDTRTGGVQAHTTETADGTGYQRLLDWGAERAPGRRVWALEGTASFAAGFVTCLINAGEDVVEVGGVKRARGSKNDRIDAVRAARHALSTEHQATPRARGLREAIRLVSNTRHALLASRTKAINELKSAIVTAPEHLRAGLRGVSLARQLDCVEALALPASPSVEHRVTVLALRSITARIRFLSAQISELDPELLTLIKAHPAGPTLLSEPGVGPVVAAQLLVSWSHRGRVRNEAAFAALAGVAPLEASSGQRSRHRLNRGGDRDLNRALHTVAITRLRCHPETISYETRRTAEGKTHRDIRRSIKRALARRLYRRIQTATEPTAPTPSGLTHIGASNGPLRQYMPKGTDLSRWSAEEIELVATTLNSRPRKTLAWKTPA
jgi:transposase